MPFPFRKRSLNPKPSPAQSQLHDTYPPLTTTPAELITFSNSLPPPFTSTANPSDPSLPSNLIAPPPHYAQALQTQPPPYNPSPSAPFAQTRSTPSRHLRQPSHPAPSPSSPSSSASEPIRYEDPKAAELARKASAANREDLKEMLDFFIRQQESAGTQAGLHGWLVGDRTL